MSTFGKSCRSPDAEDHTDAGHLFATVGQLRAWQSHRTDTTRMYNTSLVQRTKDLLLEV